MSALITHTVDDLRSGRTSWRVLLMLIGPAFVAGITIGIIPLR
jgi:hypothetical protein